MIGTWLRLHAAILLQAWRAALIAALPQGLLRALCPERWEILCTEPPAARRPSRPADTVPLASLGRRERRSAVLVAPEASVLQRRLDLPRAALLELDAMIRLDVPVSTPFALDEIHVAAAPVGRIGRDRAEVAMAMVAREAVQPWIARLAAQNLHPRWLRLGPALLVDLDPARAAREHAALRLDGLLAMLALVLAAGTALLVRQHQEDRLAVLRQALSQGLAEIDRAAALERRITALSQRIAFLPERRAEATPPMQALATVAAALPHELKLSSMTVEGAEVGLRIALNGAPPEGVRRFADTAFAPGYALTDTGTGTAEIRGRLRRSGPAEPVVRAEPVP